MSDEKKDRLETAASTALALVGAAALPSAVIPGAVGIAFLRLSDRRIKKWWELVTHGSKTPEELAERVAIGLAEDDEHVVAGVLGGARAAATSVEPAAVVIIAELSRRYFEDATLPRWFYRSALALFEQLDNGELFALRRLLREIEPIRSDAIVIAGDIDGEAQPWRAAQLSVENPYEALTPFPSPSRLFGYIKRAGLGYESRGMGFVGSPRHVVLDREVATWLREAMRDSD